MKSFRVAFLLFSVFISLFAHGSAVGARNLITAALTTNGGLMHSFSDAVNLHLATDADFGRFIDPAITGADRQLAIFFLRQEPANMRGDFTYVSRFGKVLSNRMRLASSVRIKIFTRNRLSLITTHQDTGRRGSVFPRPLSYPPTVCSGGACIRTYSSQGINALYGYVFPPCDMSLRTGESGNVYINAYDSSGNDVVDAGLGTNINAATHYDPNTSPQPPATAFVTEGGGNYFQNWNGQIGLTYPCGTPVGIMYGTLPYPNQNYSLLITGVPSFDPTQMTLPPISTTLSPAEWQYWDTPSSLMSSATTWNGISSNCSTCSVAAMITIAQPSLSFDGSCYGYCTSAGVDAGWYEVVGGQLESPCEAPPQTTSTECTIGYTTSWQGANAPYYDPQSMGIGYAAGPNQQQFAGGINLLNLGNTTSSKLRFTTGLPPAQSATCAPDSYGYCAVSYSNSLVGQCNTGYLNIHGAPIYVNEYKQVYYIFRKPRILELQEIATSTTHAEINHCTPVTTSWSPNNPATQYGDSSLP